MKTTSTLLNLFAAMILVGSVAFGQTDDTLWKEIVFGERNMGGPRLGVTFVTGSTLVNKLREKNIGTLLSQFGWHFEYQVVPEGGGPSFVIQFVPLVGGVEYGTLIPSVTLAMGVRFPEGFEFGLGPNLLLTTEGAKSALVMSVGKSFKYGGVSIPLNLVYATNPDGGRISFVFGYAIAKWQK
ncbi:MAG: hypothetical protein HY966_04010 [Ignavibacteriales bacterium]|nr:hypothetical protein [Ignavibacteriales bacterium]